MSEVLNCQENAVSCVDVEENPSIAANKSLPLTAAHFIWGNIKRFSSSTSSTAAKAFLQRSDCICVSSSSHDEEPKTNFRAPYSFPPSSTHSTSLDGNHSMTSSGNHSMTIGNHSTESCGTKSKTNSEKRKKRIAVHIYLYMQVCGFKPIPHIIGQRGRSLRRIASQTDAKIRVRGRGSGHLECGSEAPTPLMIAVTAPITDPSGFKTAFLMVLKELDQVAARFKKHCQRTNFEFEGHAYSVGHLVGGADEVLRDCLKDIPVVGRPVC